MAVLDAQGALLPGVEVEFHGGVRVTTDATGRATFTAPEQPGVLLVQAVNSKVMGSTLVVQAAANQPDGIQVADVPQVVSLNEPFTVAGSGFHGEAEGTRAWLRDKPALVLAASPVALVVQPAPGIDPGATQLVIECGGRSPGPQALTLVELQISAEKKQLAPKEKAKLRVAVRGSEMRLEVELRNLSPEVVKLDGADTVRVVTHGGDANSAEVELEGRRAGEFSVSARLIPVAAGLPNVEAARRKLLEARRIAPSGWVGRLDAVIEHLEKHPQDTQHAQLELEKMLAGKPAGDFGRLLEAAWLILLNH